MRFLILLTLLSVLVSCGQGGSSSSSSNKPQNEEYVTDIREVDLLDVAMDVPVEISRSQITFKQSAGNTASGVRSTCSVGVSSGEVYGYNLDGSNLVIKTSNGTKMTLKRVSGDDNSIVGSWSGKSNSGGQLVLRRMTFVSENRLVMRTHCES